jgi:hypothetical protein
VKGLSLVSAAGKAGREMGTPETSGRRDRVLLLNTMVVGAKYRDDEDQDAAAYLVPGDKVDLVPEPDNEHDHLALKVVAHPELQKAPTLGSKPGGYHIGYIQKGLNAAPHRMIVAGFEVEGVVLPTRRPGQIWVRISLIADE